MLSIKQKIEWCLLHVFWCLPIKQRRIVFICYNCTQYSCNPKYISEYLHIHYPDLYELIWFYTTNDIRDEIPEYVAKYKKNSLKYFISLMTADVVISNVTLPRVVPFRKKQCKINTWHGTAFKGDKNKHGNDYNRFDYFLAENLLTCNVFNRKDSFNYKGKIEKIGMPRNDILIRGDIDIKKAIYDELGIPYTDKLILYAPTFRESEGTECFDIDLGALIKTLSLKDSSNWRVLFRYHHMQENKVYIEGGIDVTSYPDMQRLLIAADILITDYSSTMWDFSLTGKQVILYATDIDRYINEERGEFYYPIEKLPFPIARNNTELQNIGLLFDKKTYDKEVARYHRELGRFNYQGDATQKFVKKFLEI